MKLERAALGLILGALVGCGHHPTSGDATASTSASSAPAGSASEAAAAAPNDRASAILAAEHRRAASLITPADQQSRDVAVRRAAARALARIGGESARAGLVRALSDEDAEVVAWAAFGLGFTCKKHEKEAVAALTARAVTDLDAKEARLDPWLAIARAIGKCAADESEPTLVAWLAGPRPRALAAAIALGDVATVKTKLREETLAALLNLAAGSAATPPVPDALYAIGRLDHLPPSVVERLREVATARLAEPGAARFLAVRALSHANEDAAVELERVLTTPGTFTFAERAEAARGLKLMGRTGLRLLGESLAKLTPSNDPIAVTGLISEDTGVLLTALEVLNTAAESGRTTTAANKEDDKHGRDHALRDAEHLGPKAKKALGELASFSAPKGAPAPILRRASWIRCLAAKALAGSDYRDKALAGCDLEAPAKADEGVETPPDGLPATTIGARAVVEVIGRARIEGPRLAAFRAYAEGGELRAREAALELIGDHDEIKASPEILEKALTSKHAGLIGGAADVLTKHPQRASVAAKPAKKKRRKKGHAAEPDEPAAEPAAPSQGIVDALTAILGDPAHQNDPELIDGVIDAIGALAIAGAKAKLTELCHSAYPTTREHAEKALGLLGDKVTCSEPAEGGAEPVELSHLVVTKTKLELETDAGAFSIELDPTFAPVAVTRFVGLARDHFYDGIVVHRVVSGFVTQFGAPDGDGSGGPKDLPALRCETSPLGFDLGAIGVALSGRDTGSSQLFVMQASAPHLDGQYALVGHASGSWGAFVDGDRIRKVTISP